MEPEGSFRVHKSPLQIPRPCETFRNQFAFLLWGVVSPSHNAEAGGPPLDGSSQLLNQSIPIYEYKPSPPSKTGGHAMQQW